MDNQPKSCRPKKTSDPSSVTRYSENCKTDLSSHLDEIVDAVEKNGSHCEQWYGLINVYFRGDDCLEQIQAWAARSGLRVTFDSKYQSCTFQKNEHQSR